MSESEDSFTKYTDVVEASRIFILPNLMTAANLFCGFVAITKCIQAKFATSGTVGDELFAQGRYDQAVWFILFAVIFDVLDGRLARLGGKESLFGKEFDSIADVVSFGVAPCLLTFFLILSPTEEFPTIRDSGWIISFIYLLCAAVRLARFNVITHPFLVKPDKNSKQEDNFRGLPVPAAAGLIASLVLVVNRHELRGWSLFMPILLILTAFLMVSNIPYPSFRRITWTTEIKTRNFVYLISFLGIVYMLRKTSWLASSIPAIIFVCYIFFGLFRYIFYRYFSPSGNTCSEPPVDVENYPE